MASWEAIEGTFTRLRDFVLNDLGRYVAQAEGGNFAVVSIAMTACDALGRLCYGRDSGDRVFERCLPDTWRPAAPLLYEALRHGLVHSYEAQLIRDDSSTVGFVIGWRGEDHHLQFVTRERALLYVSAPELVNALQAMFTEMEQVLRNDESLRDTFYVNDRRGREIHLSGVSRDRADAWRQAVLDARVIDESWPPGTLPAGATGPGGPRA